MWVSLLFLLCAAAFSQAEECKCWDGYRAESTENGWRCVGINLFHMMPCNVVKPPRCQCSGNVTGILKDKTGTWCSQYKNGQEISRWHCENKEEWDEFFKKHPDYQ